jgi:hypothetical protein
MCNSAPAACDEGMRTIRVHSFVNGAILVADLAMDKS